MSEYFEFPFRIGDIVAFNSHPYFENNQSIIIAGESQLVAPLLVVVETLLDTKVLYDEKTSEEISKPGFGQCKCIWYSNKSCQFEETWLSSKLLKLINRPEPSDEDRQTKNGKLAVLKTAVFEIKKIKSSLTTETNNFLNIKKDKSINNSLLSYLSPVVQIIQVVEYKDDPKETQYDQKTGKKKRFTSKYLAKVKWYNPNDKFSEKILPFECLEFLPEINPIDLEKIKNAIENSDYFEYNKSIIQPKSVCNLNGLYFLNAFSLITNKNIRIEINKINEFIDIDKSKIEEYPSLDLEDGSEIGLSFFENQYLKAIKRAISEELYVRIFYTKKNNERIIRTLREVNFKKVKIGINEITYLIGHDETRKADRHFKIKRITRLQILNLKFEVKEGTIV